MNCETCSMNTKRNTPTEVQYIVYEMEQARSERNIKRTVMALIVAITMFFISNLMWLSYITKTLSKVTETVQSVSVECVTTDGYTE